MSYEYDANGNVSHHSGQSDVVSYQYDSWLNKVTYREEATLDGFLKTNYAYNASNERMWKQVQQSDNFLHTTETVYLHGDNPWPLVEKETYQKQNLAGTVTYQTQSTVKWHIYGKNGIIATHTNAESIEFPLKDHLGSPRVVLKQTITQGGVSGLSENSRYAWHPFGGILQSYGDSEPQYGFTGQEKDYESGLQNFRARQYHENLGRFFAVDPQGQFHSPYVYAGNNPFMIVDPDGEWIWLVPILIGATMNVVQNWDHIKSQGDIWSQIGTGLGYAAIGGGSAAIATFGGPAGWAAGGFMQGSLNAGIQGQKFGEAMLQGGLGAASGIVGGFAGQYASKLGMGIMINKFAVTSPVLMGGVTGAIGGAAGGYAGGFTAGYLATGDLSKAHEMGWASAKSGGALGAGIGSGSAYYSARQQGINPWSGKPEKLFFTGRYQDDRVNPHAERLGAETISKDFNENINRTDEYGIRFRNQETLVSKEFNRDWFLGKMNDGYHNFDIGPGNATRPSHYYNMELRLGLQFPMQNYNYNYFNRFGLDLHLWYRK